MKAVVVPMKASGDELTTDLEAIEAQIEQLGRDSVVCVATTTSCFAPRAADDVIPVAQLCLRLGELPVANSCRGFHGCIQSNLLSICRGGCPVKLDTMSIATCTGSSIPSLLDRAEHACFDLMLISL